MPTRAYRPGTSGATTPFSGTFNYERDSLCLSITCRSGVGYRPDLSHHIVRLLILCCDETRHVVREIPEVLSANMWVKLCLAPSKSLRVHDSDTWEVRI